MCETIRNCGGSDALGYTVLWVVTEERCKWSEGSNEINPLSSGTGSTLRPCVTGGWCDVECNEAFFLGLVRKGLAGGGGKTARCGTRMILNWEFYSNEVEIELIKCKLTCGAYHGFVVMSATARWCRAESGWNQFWVNFSKHKAVVHRILSWGEGSTPFQF